MRIAIIATAASKRVIAAIAVDKLTNIRALDQIGRFIAMQLSQAFGRLHNDLLDLIQ